MKIEMWRVFKILDIYKNVRDLRVPAPVAYKFNKLCTSLDNDSKFYNEELNKIIEQYADKDENGLIKTLEDGGIQIKEGQVEIAQKEIDNLRELEVDVPDIYFDIKELEGLPLSIAEFNWIIPFIKED